LGAADIVNRRDIPERLEGHADIPRRRRLTCACCYACTTDQAGLQAKFVANCHFLYANRRCLAKELQHKKECSFLRKRTKDFGLFEGAPSRQFDLPAEGRTDRSKYLKGAHTSAERPISSAGSPDARVRSVRIKPLVSGASP
jgi:hypothetical protein